MDHLDPANLPPNSGWEVLWTSPNATQYFVEMDTFDPTSGVQFHYGHVDPTLGESTDGTMDRVENYDSVELAIARADDIRGVLERDGWTPDET